MAQRPLAPVEGVVSQTTPTEVAKLLKGLPTIQDYLLSPTWEDGVLKDQRCLFVFPSSAGVRLLLKVGPPALKLSVTAPTWDDAWASLEAVLRSDVVPWEPDANGAPARKKGGRK